jgi:tight adherence protein B
MQMFGAVDPRYVAYILLGVAVALAAEALFLWLRYLTTYRHQINSRLKLTHDFDDRRQALVALRRKRGLSPEGQFVLPVIWFNRLVTQSGVSLEVRVLPWLMLAAAAVSTAVTYFFFASGVVLAVVVGAGIGFGIPLQFLRILRGRRMRRFEAQLPDGIDVMVRSLRAGHPIPVALSMVARELPDPIGSEFGIAYDELTYGQDMEIALANMRSRVGQQDLSLLVLAVSVQSKTGGALSEILANLSKVLRERFKMRRKVRALSAEGRFSAIGLSLLPFIVSGIIFLTAPGFYGEVWNDPIFRPVVLFAILLLVVGDYVMYRMVNFKF